MNIYIDGHCDTLTCAYDDKRTIEDLKYDFNLSDAKYISEKNKIPIIQLMATFVNPKFQDGFGRATEVIDYNLKNIKEELIIKNTENLKHIIREKLLGVILTIENGKAIEDNLNNIDILYEKGIRLMSINWNEDNLLGTGALTNTKLGLTKLGIEYIKKLEEKNIIIDISHSSEKTFWDVIKNTKKPIVATHSCCYEICRHPRNLKNEQIKKIAERKGIIGICLCSSFLKNNGRADVQDVITHIKHIINLEGDDFVGLGTDFDGVEEEHKLADIKKLKDMNILVENLAKRAFNKRTIDKIMGENWYRVINENLEVTNHS